MTADDILNLVRANSTKISKDNNLVDPLWFTRNSWNLFYSFFLKKFRGRELEVNERIMHHYNNKLQELQFVPLHSSVGEFNVLLTYSFFCPRNRTWTQMVIWKQAITTDDDKFRSISSIIHIRTIIYKQQQILKLVFYKRFYFRKNILRRDYKTYSFNNKTLFF